TPVVNAPSYTFDETPPEVTASGTASLTCHIIPTVTVLVFDLIGPHASLDLWAKLAGVAAAPLTGGPVTLTANVYAGGSLTVGAGLEFMGYNAANWDAPSLDFGPTAPLWTASMPIASDPTP